ncbi:MAG TPA: helix-turn-helix domain-containing protein [Gammaproteobacteria bacterium]|nr:helix-turn-helix domain-containing protein [Gammaproteobacteria bacterium]
MIANPKKIMRSQPTSLPVSRMVEDIVGCKWALTILQLVRRGIARPGAMERSVAGLTTKVLNERLKKLVNYGIIERLEYPEIPPRVEYSMTAFGMRFVSILDAIEALEQQVNQPD